MIQYFISGLFGIFTTGFFILAGLTANKVDEVKRTSVEKSDKKLNNLVLTLVSNASMAIICFVVALTLLISGMVYENHDKNFIDNFTEYSNYISTLKLNELTEEEKTVINEQIIKKNGVLAEARLIYLRSNYNGWRAYTKEVLEIKPIPKI